MLKRDGKPIFIVISKLCSNPNMIVIGKILRKRGYERLGNGPYFMKVVDNHYTELIIEAEAQWIWNHGMEAYKTQNTKKLRTRFSPFNEERK